VQAHDLELFAASLHPMLIADDARRYVDANPAACRFLRRSREEILRLRIDDLTPPEDRVHIPALWASFIAGGTQAGRYRLLLPDGDKLEIEYSATASIAPGRHLCLFDPNPPPEDYAQTPSAERGSSLSERELQVLVMLALGASGAQIAKSLVISPETVRTHVDNIRGKLGASTRAHAVTLGFQTGQIRL
jgi:DNA-binding CsgD family transcriptional regulator